MLMHLALHFHRTTHPDGGILAIAVILILIGIFSGDKKKGRR